MKHSNWVFALGLMLTGIWPLSAVAQSTTPDVDPPCIRPGYSCLNSVELSGLVGSVFEYQHPKSPDRFGTVSISLHPNGRASGSNRVTLTDGTWAVEGGRLKVDMRLWGVTRYALMRKDDQLFYVFSSEPSDHPPRAAKLTLMPAPADVIDLATARDGTVLTSGTVERLIKGKRITADLKFGKDVVNGAVYEFAENGKLNLMAGDFSDRGSWQVEGGGKLCIELIQTGRACNTATARGGKMQLSYDGWIWFIQK